MRPKISVLFFILISAKANALNCNNSNCINSTNVADFRNNTTIDIMKNNGVVRQIMQNNEIGIINENMINNGSASYIINRGTVYGDIINDGTVQYDIENTVPGVIHGSMVNNYSPDSEFSAFLMFNKGKIDANMINSASLERDMSNISMGPAATVGLNMINSATGRIGTSMNNDSLIGGNMENSGSISKNMNNSGTISGEMINSGIIGGDLKNTGAITQGILNSGTVQGKIEIGDASLTLSGRSASVAGTITGGEASSLSVGNSVTSASYKAASGNDATVGSISVTQGSKLTLDDGIIWSTAGSNAAINNEGTVVLNNSSLWGNLANTGILTLGSESSISATISGSVSNTGSIVLNPTDHSAGNTLTISGNYTGTPGSTVRLGTVLGGDNSLTDLLNITGNTGGQSIIYVTNENGTGAKTLEGIKVIAVGGTSAATFSLGDRVVAGAYDYSLKKGTGGYYLTSVYEPAPAPTPAPAPAPAVTHTIRPEVGSYTASLRAVNTLFSFSLRDREGEQNFTGTSEQVRAEPGMWMRNEGGYNSASTSDKQNHTDSARYVLQMGGEVARWSTDAVNQFSLGLMGGYATQHSNTRNALTGYRSQADIHGYSAGTYATWRQNAADKTGLYADSWMQYSWFSTQVKGDDLDAEHYGSRGLSASLESGYAMRVSQWRNADRTENALYVEPHMQAVWSDVRSDSFSEASDTRVSGTGNDNVQLRLGIRTYLNGKSRYDRDTVREFQPFVEADWIYNTQQYGVRLNDTAFRAAGERNIGELKTGIEARLGERFSGWATVAQQVGGSGYHDTSGLLGIRFTF